MTGGELVHTDRRGGCALTGGKLVHTGRRSVSEHRDRDIPYPGSTWVEAPSCLLVGLQPASSWLLERKLKPACRSESRPGTSALGCAFCHVLPAFSFQRQYLALVDLLYTGIFGHSWVWVCCFGLLLPG